MKSGIGIASSALVFAAAIALGGCTTEPGETTGIGASAGGVIGAGLGAIIGNQSGDPGTGLAMGAVAGSATGALIGNALEAQQQAIRTQDEALERQQQMIMAQRAEMNELRHNARDEAVPASAPRFGTAPARTAGAGIHAAALYGSAAKSPSVPDSPAARDTSKALTAPLETDDTRSAYRWGSEQPEAPKPSSQCAAADSEVRLARSAMEQADKLFHMRRALRLCPADAALHNSLGELYRAFNRPADAEFEFKEALRLDGDNEAARRNLNSLQSVAAVPAADLERGE